MSHVQTQAMNTPEVLVVDSQEVNNQIPQERILNMDLKSSENTSQNISNIEVKYTQELTNQNFGMRFWVNVIDTSTPGLQPRFDLTCMNEYKTPSELMIRSNITPDPTSIGQAGKPLRVIAQQAKFYLQ